MAWYNTGNIALTNGSATVTGSGTNFLVGAQIGEALYAPDGKLYEIQTINSATVITLASTYLGSTASGQNYQIIPTQSLVADLASDVTDLISDFANVRDYAGNGKFNDGAVGTPGITFTQDQDNGLYRIGSNNWALAAGAQKIVDISTSGIDVTGSVTADGLTVQTTGSTTAVLTLNNADGNGTLSQINLGYTADPDHGNIQYTGDMIFTAAAAERMRITSAGIDVTGSVTADGMVISSSGTARLDFAGGNGEKIRLRYSSNEFVIGTNGLQNVYAGYQGHIFETGSFGGPEAMRIDNNRKLLIGDSASHTDDLLQIETPASGGGHGIQIRRNDTNTDQGVGRIQFGNNTATDLASISAKTDGASDNGALLFNTSVSGGANTERLRLDSSGNLALMTDGAEIKLYYTEARKFISNSGASVTIKQIDNNAGLAYIDFAAWDNSSLMRLMNSGSLLVGTTDLSPHNNTSGNGVALSAGSGVDVAVADGETLYLNRMGSNGRIVNFRRAGAFMAGIDVTTTAVAYNTSSDQRLKDNIADADDAGSKIDAIQVRKFDWKADGSHQDYGMVAQELLEVAPEAVSAPEDPEEMMGVDYSKLVPMMLKEIQSLRARVAQLES